MSLGYDYKPCNTTVCAPLTSKSAACVYVFFVLVPYLWDLN